MMNDTNPDITPIPDAEDRLSLEPETSPDTNADATPETVAPLHPAGNRVTELEAENARLKDHILRALADADNTRKRAVKEREDATKFAVTGFARDMLEIADNFRRALDSVPEEVKTAADPLLVNLLTGIDAIERGLLRTFEKHGIKKIEPIGEMFNPHFHEVMFEAPIPNKQPGTIIQVLEAGYTLNERLLRPARVGVSKADSAEGSGPAHKIDESV